MRQSPIAPTASQGVLALVLATSFDAVTTIVGLSLVPALTELNPVARASFEVLGLVGGVVAVSTGAIVAVALTTELATFFVERKTTHSSDAAATVRLFGYGIPSLLWFLIAVHNLALVTTQLSSL